MQSNTCKYCGITLGKTRSGKCYSCKEEEKYMKREYKPGDEIIILEDPENDNLIKNNIYVVQSPLNHYKHSINVVAVINENGGYTYIETFKIREATIKDKIDYLIK